MVLAQLAGVAPSTIAALAVAFLALRIVHGAAYIADRAALRSLAWFGALGCVVTLLVRAALAVG